ncbi:MAG: Gfo/Idh/MocA family oxidoreductase [Kiritimatiellae bacterium]|nr:Gfo/Idh/MocA family oxidoreductase [Kiritimatiellia bacterium]
MMKVSRRSFFKGMGAASVPFILPAGLRAADANGKLNIGFIGMGTQARGLMGNFLHQDVNVVAVCDVDTTRREAGCKRVDQFYTEHPEKGKPGNCKGYRDFREVIARKDIDLVCVATPDHWHAYQTVEALKSGKHVYCEKPLTYSIAEAKLVMEASKKYGKIVQTGAMQRSGIEFWTACMLVRNGVIGKVKVVQAHFGGPAHLHFDPNPPQEMEPGLDWDMWCGPGPLVPYDPVLSPRGVHDGFPNWREDDFFASGGVGDWGAHHMDIGQWGLGMDESGPVKVIPANWKSNDRRRGFRATNGAKLVYADGAVMEHAGGSTWGTIFFGTEGIVCVNRGRIAAWRGKEGVPDKETCRRIENGSFDGMERICFFNNDRKFMARQSEIYGNLPEMNGSNEQACAIAAKRFNLSQAATQLYRVKGGHPADFVKCAKDGTQPCSRAEVGARTSIICQLVNTSYIHGNAAFDWDPAKNEFGAGGDAKWLMRRIDGINSGYRNGFFPTV